MDAGPSAREQLRTLLGAMWLRTRKRPASFPCAGMRSTATGPANGQPCSAARLLVAVGLDDRRAASNDRRRVELTVTPQGRELGPRAKRTERSCGASTAAKLDHASLTAACTALEALLHDTPLAATVIERRQRPWTSGMHGADAEHERPIRAAPRDGWGFSGQAKRGLEYPSHGGL